MTMYRRGDMSPWAEGALTREEQALVRASVIVGLGGRSPSGPWVAQGPAGRFVNRDIRRVINEAAGQVVLPEGGG